MEMSKNILLSALLIIVLAAVDWVSLSLVIASILRVFGKSRGVGFGITLHYATQFLVVVSTLGLFISIFRGHKFALIAALIGHGAVMIYLWPGTDARKFMAVIVSSYFLFFVMLKLLSKSRSDLRLTQ
jgi:hypothetical protein